MRILLIEDDSSTADFITKGFIENGYLIDNASDGEQGLFLATTEKYDVIVVDRVLPYIDGLTIIKKLRQLNNKTPTLILSALDHVDERINGLKSGADDYLVKPFDLAELLARIESLLRRQQSDSAQTKLQVSDLEMDLLTHKVSRSGKNFSLQPREYRLLEYLMKHTGQVVTRTMLLEHVWEYNFDPQTNVIDVHISRLRQKIDKGFDRQLLSTVRGSGYMLRCPEMA